jgi:hypothetical protein
MFIEVFIVSSGGGGDGVVKFPSSFIFSFLGSFKAYILV